ncbi:phosphotransferase [Eubacterium sp.]|uniref:phosphotransferase n=1 Tax=Eubacterium sp. TaxID=142586 RepID=UPI001D9DA5D4|nr:phosphotransferase [Eubacterium sp.]MBS5620718.1 phosphotransferase [Eubacterium sp.]
MEDKITVYKSIPYYFSNKDLKEMCEIVNQIEGEQYTLVQDALVYKWKKGQTIYPHSINELESVAISMAEMHILLEKIESIYCPIQYYTHFPNINGKTIDLMVMYFKNKFHSCDWINCSLQIAKHKLENVDLPRQIIHGDAHPYNVLMDNGKISWIDFTDVHYDIRTIDIVWFIVFSLCWDEEYKYMKTFDVRCVKRFIDAYNSINKLYEVELENLPFIFAILLVYSMFSVHSLWRIKKKEQYINYNISKLQENIIYLVEDLKWSFH